MCCSTGELLSSTMQNEVGSVMKRTRIAHQTKSSRRWPAVFAREGCWRRAVNGTLDL